MTPEANDLQFDRAEFAEGAAPATVCANCNDAITGVYYEVHGKTICPGCQLALIQVLTGGSGAGRFFRALVFGIAAGAVGTGIYFAILALTGYEIGLVAIVVGFLVGGAVRKGSNGRGGWFYQGMAVILTYCSITTSFVPLAIRSLNASVAAESDAAINPGPNEVAKVVVTGEGSLQLNGRHISLDEAKAEFDRLKRVDGVVWFYISSDEEDSAPPIAGEILMYASDLGLPSAISNDADFTSVTNISTNISEIGEWDDLSLGGKIVLFIVYCVFALAIPFIDLNIMSMLIIGFALYTAWKMNKRTVVQITGPYRVGSRWNDSPPAAIVEGE